jgi:hypothetical protein
LAFLGNMSSSFCDSVPRRLRKSQSSGMWNSVRHWKCWRLTIWANGPIFLSSQFSNAQRPDIQIAGVLPVSRGCG